MNVKIVNDDPPIVEGIYFSLLVLCRAIFAYKTVPIFIQIVRETLTLIY